MSNHLYKIFAVAEKPSVAKEVAKILSHHA